jgi:hypothetical protein
MLGPVGQLVGLGGREVSASRNASGTRSWMTSGSVVRYVSAVADYGAGRPEELLGVVDQHKLLDLASGSE